MRASHTASPWKQQTPQIFLFTMTNTEEPKLPRAHILPFSVQKEGPVNSQQYFLCNPTANADHKHATLPTFETIMMGRRMYGYEIAVNEATCQGNTVHTNHYIPACPSLLKAK